MQNLKTAAVLSMGLMVAACGTNTSAPQAAGLQTGDSLAFRQAGAAQPAEQAQPSSLKVQAVKVIVPSTLKVSEANSYYPRADIVWRGDDFGNRYEQVAAIFQNAFVAGTKDMNGTTPTVLEVEVIRFHSLTEKARYSVGGVHNMHFKLTMRHAQTGALLAPPREVEANLDAFGGGQAYEAERRGQTQKVRVTGYLAQVIQRELAKPQADTRRGANRLGKSTYNG